MITGFWGKKVGMTQVFSGDQLIPVTVIDTSCWRVLGFRTKESDGYNAIRVGRMRERYVADSFSDMWLKRLKSYFTLVKEVPVAGDLPALTIGQTVDLASLIEEGTVVAITGTSTGRGFAGVVRRHGFAGGPASHGDEMGKAPGSGGHMHAEGRVIKGKRLPGRFGGTTHTVKGLRVVKFYKDKQCVLLKGPVPGRSGSFVFVKKT